MSDVSRVLIVDDEKDFREIMSTKFTAEGFEVYTAQNGDEARSRAAELLPDIVLMDIHLLDETGTDIALSIKQNEKNAQTKIAFLTSMKEPWPAVSGDKEKIARELGMEDFIEKGEDLNQIVKEVREILSRGVEPPSEEANVTTDSTINT